MPLFNSNQPSTYHLANATALFKKYPFLNAIYTKYVNMWGQRKFLEAPRISDQFKIKVVQFVSPEDAQNLETAVKFATKANETAKSVKDIAEKASIEATENIENLSEKHRNIVSKVPGSIEAYKKWSEFGGKKTKRNRRSSKRTQRRQR